MVRVSEFGPSTALDDDEVAAAYLSAALEDENPDVFLPAIGLAAKARGMSAIAERADLEATSYEQEAQCDPPSDPHLARFHKAKFGCLEQGEIPYMRLGIAHSLWKLYKRPQTIRVGFAARPCVRARVWLEPSRRSFGKRPKY
jgi:probable addiction module antidote protein